LKNPRKRKEMILKTSSDYSKEIEFLSLDTRFIDLIGYERGIIIDELGAACRKMGVKSGSVFQSAVKTNTRKNIH
jgi:hypothetical protein